MSVNNGPSLVSNQAFNLDWAFDFETDVLGLGGRKSQPIYITISPPTEPGISNTATSSSSSRRSGSGVMKAARSLLSRSSRSSAQQRANARPASKGRSR